MGCGEVATVSTGIRKARCRRLKPICILVVCAVYPTLVPEDVTELLIYSLQVIAKSYTFMAYTCWAAVLPELGEQAPITIQVQIRGPGSWRRPVALFPQPDPARQSFVESSGTHWFFPCFQPEREYMRHLMLCILVSVMSLLIPLTSQAANTYYVDKNGVGGGVAPRIRGRRVSRAVPLRKGGNS